MVFVDMGMVENTALLLRRWLWGRFVLILSLVWNYIVEAVPAWESEVAHEVEDSLLFILGLNHKVHVVGARR